MRKMVEPESGQSSGEARSSRSSLTRDAADSSIGRGGVLSSAVCDAGVDDGRASTDRDSDGSLD